jgi:hypothetical protein
MKAKLLSSLLLIAFLGVFPVFVWAQQRAPAQAAGAHTQPKTVVRAKQAENLLDFEAEVIEGEKKRPELFLDIKAGDGNVGSGLYLRPNFDDFFAVDKKRRPKFIKAK